MEISYLLKNQLRVGALLLLLSGTFSCAKVQEVFSYEPQTEVGKALLYNAAEVARVYKDTSFVVAVGVEETDITFQVMEGFPERICVLKIDTSVPGVNVRVAMPNNNANIEYGWKFQSLTDMAAALDKSGARVVGMVNGDFWDSQANVPRGPVHMNGSVVSEVWNPSEKLPQQALSFIGVGHDGKMVIASKDRYPYLKDQLAECTGAGLIVLQNGEFPGTDWQQRDPRTAIGYTADGIVYFITGDGRETIGAYGLKYKELASFFRALGCDNAANLDGGGSAQFLVRHPVAQVFQVRNRPSDGKERPVINAWAVTVDEQ